MLLQLRNNINWWLTMIIWVGSHTQTILSTIHLLFEAWGWVMFPHFIELIYNNANWFQIPGLFFIMMRINLKTAWCCLCGLVLFIMLSLWSRCGFNSSEWNKPSRLKSYDRISDHISDTQLAKEIECYINSEYSINCRKEGDEVYLPFTFLHRYFEVSFFK